MNGNFKSRSFFIFSTFMASLVRDRKEVLNFLASILCYFTKIGVLCASNPREITDWQIISPPRKWEICRTSLRPAPQHKRVQALRDWEEARGLVLHPQHRPRLPHPVTVGGLTVQSTVQYSTVQYSKVQYSTVQSLVSVVRWRLWTMNTKLYS